MGDENKPMSIPFAEVANREQDYSMLDCDPARH
jgi:hypothetical protein